VLSRDTDAIWRLAEPQWAEIGANTPDLVPAIALQRRLLRLMLDALRAVEEARPIELTVQPAREKWHRGLPALRSETISIPPGLNRFLPPLCTALAECGAGESALHIRDAITSKNIDADSLLAVSLARNQKAVRTSALHMGFSPDLVWLIGELGSAPLAHHLSSAFELSAPRDDEWDRGYCPICGSWPALIESRDGSAKLRCSYCAFEWSLRSNRCLYCGNDGADFVTAAPDINEPQRRVELCGRCSGYTKVIEVLSPTPFPLLAIHDLATMSLDQGAMNRGYRRPALFDLDAIEPRASTC
jgi:FdhE protein